MMSYGTRYQVTVFGSSHGPQVGAEVAGVPPGTPLDVGRIQADLDRRSPVGRRWATKRQEADRAIVDSGLEHGKATGAPLRLHVANEDVDRAPYEKLGEIPRPGHADYPARVRYGAHADLSGGGIFSGRMTVGLVIAGAIGRQMLESKGIEVGAYTRSIGPVESAMPAGTSARAIRERALTNDFGAVDDRTAAQMEAVIAEARRDGDSVGGVIEGQVDGVPVGVGEPFFDSVESAIGHLAFSIPAVKAVEFGAGFSATRMRGSEHNDPFIFRDGRVRTETNHAGGVLGGLATGEPVVFRVAVKPTSSIARPQRSVDIATGRPVELVVTGRHDPCIVPRAVVVVESIAAIGLTDLLLRGGFLP